MAGRVRDVVRRRRALAMTGTVAAIGLLGAVGMVSAPIGPASAQSGSRVCGYIWKTYTPYPRRMLLAVARVAEVPKTEMMFSCNIAETQYDQLPAADLIKQVTGQDITFRERDDNTLETGTWQRRWVSGTCEELGAQLGTADPCLQMNRSDSVFEMNEYLWGSLRYRDVNAQQDIAEVKFMGL